MPSVSAPQAKLMSAIAHGWKPAGAAAKHLPPLAVAREFHEADKKQGKFMHYKADGGKVGELRAALDAIANKLPTAQQRLARAGSQLTDLGHDPYNSADAQAARAALGTATDEAMFGVAHPEEGWADGGKISGVVDFAKQGTKALMGRIQGAFDNPYTANTDQLRQDVAKYWHTNAPKVTPPEPNMQKIDTSELDAMVNKDPSVPGLADGGLFGDQGPPRKIRRDTPEASADPKTNHLGLIRHASDRVSAAVTDDPHHMLARIAGGLSTQLAGLSPSGTAEFGRVPGIVSETKALPAGLIDLGKGAADVAGSVAGALQEKGYGSTTGTAIQAIKEGLQRLQDKYGDLAPSWSRKAEADSDALHAAVHKQMDLSPPKGFAENSAEALGMMLGQLPMGAEESGAKILPKILKSPIEWLSPTVRPSVANYGVGALAGGALGAAGDNNEPPQVAAQ